MPDQKCKEEYIRRIHRVQDYIEQHIGEPISIEVLAQEAGFSKYHFSRIFQGILHESLLHYVNRIRMEQALFLLAHRQDKNVTDIAYEMGISDSAVFSRAFRNYFGVSPREYRKAYSKNCKDSFLLSDYNKGAAKKEGAQDLFPVEGQITVTNLEEKQVIYVRHTGTYETLAKEYEGLLQILLTYAEEQNLFMRDGICLLVMYHDNPEFGDASQFRTSLCLTVPEDFSFPEDGIFGRMKVEGGLYAAGHFQIPQKHYPDAWNYMYREWISASGYVPRNSYPFELYHLSPCPVAGSVHELDIYVPIEPIHF